MTSTLKLSNYFGMKKSASGSIQIVRQPAKLGDSHFLISQPDDGKLYCDCPPNSIRRENYDPSIFFLSHPRKSLGQRSIINYDSKGDPVTTAEDITERRSERRPIIEIERHVLDGFQRQTYKDKQHQNDLVEIGE